jgi:hypothetical protein
MRKIGRLLDRQAVHIGSETDRARRAASLQPADEPGFANSTEHFVPEFGEPLRNEIGGSLLLKPELGVRMNITPPFCQFIVNFCDRSTICMAASLSPAAEA